MRGTRHNGRSGKNGVYDPKHNDRRFNVENSDHIIQDEVWKNIYWDYFQGYTQDPNMEKTVDFHSFNEIELVFYEDHFGDYVRAQNERHRKARHSDRCKSVEDVLKNKKTCPEESIFQLGTMDDHASSKLLVEIFEEFKDEFEARFGSNIKILDWSLHMDEATPHIHERHVFFAENRYGEIEPKQEEALKQLGFELPDPEQKRSRNNNRKMVFDSACRVMFLDICKKHGLNLEEEPSYGGRAYLEKQDFIRMKQKQEIKENKDILEVQDLRIQKRADTITMQDAEIEEKHNQITRQGAILQFQSEKIIDATNQLEQLTLEIDDIEALLQDVSDVAYEKAVEEVTNEVMVKTRQDDIRLIEGTKTWLDQPERKASKKEISYAKERLDGVIKKIKNAMSAVQSIKDSLLQPKTKEKVVEEIKDKARPSIMSRLTQKKKELAEREANKKNDLKKSWNRDDR